MLLLRSVRKFLTNSEIQSAGNHGSRSHDGVTPINRIRHTNSCVMSDSSWAMLGKSAVFCANKNMKSFLHVGRLRSWKRLAAFYQFAALQGWAGHTAYSSGAFPDLWKERQQSLFKIAMLNCVHDIPRIESNQNGRPNVHRVRHSTMSTKSLLIESLPVPSEKLFQAALSSLLPWVWGNWRRLYTERARYWEPCRSLGYLWNGEVKIPYLARRRLDEKGNGTSGTQLRHWPVIFRIPGGWHKGWGQPFIAIYGPATIPSEKGKFLHSSVPQSLDFWRRSSGS